MTAPVLRFPGAADPAPRWEHHPMRACIDCLTWIDSGELAGATPGWGPDLIQARWPASDGWGLVTGDAEREDPFSWQPCECCGSRLGGSRHEVIAMRQPR